jgi:hypothetical protein
MGYVSEREFRFFLLTPLLWTFAWVVFHRLPDFGSSEQLSRFSWARPCGGSPAAGAPDLRLFVVLAVANAIIFGLLT